MSRTSQRPVTWAGLSLGPDLTSTGFGGSNPASEPDVLELYKRAWEQQATFHSNDHTTTHPATHSLDAVIPLAALHKSLCTAGGQSAGAAEKIVNLACQGARCSRNEWYTAMALLTQSQEGRHLDLDEARQQLASGTTQQPQWNFSKLLTDVSFGHTFPPSKPAEQNPVSSFRDMSDPWGSVGATHHTGLQNHQSTYGSSYRGFAHKASSSEGFNGLSNGFDTTEAHPPMGNTPGLPSGPSALSQLRSEQEAAMHERPFSYLSEANEVNAINSAEDPASELREDEVTVRLRSELEGFLMKHNVYLVSSTLRKSQVTRRYSDWVWLAECLVKRYPFRCLPVLPPKRLSMPIPGRHLTSDDLFIERRRRSLERYLRILSLHPVLREDKLVAVFFTEKQALSDWRTTAPPLYLDEEGITKIVDEAERMGIPDDLDHKLTQQRKAVPDLLERWTSMVALLERIVKRRDADAADFSRLNFSLLSVIESSAKRWRPESDHRKLTEEIMAATANIFQDHSDMSSSRVSVVSLSTLEGLKAQRDLLLSFRDLLARLDRLLPDPIDGLKKRIEANQRKLSALAGTPATPSTQTEQAKLTTSVNQDTQSIQKFLNRRTHTKKTLWEELIWFHYRFKAVEEDLQKLVRDEAYFLSMLTRIWETTEMKMKMIR